MCNYSIVSMPGLAGGTDRAPLSLLAGAWGSPAWEELVGEGRGGRTAHSLKWSIVCEMDDEGKRILPIEPLHVVVSILLIK